jgi:hypothetical protein
MLPEHGSGSEACLKGDALDGELSGFQQTLGATHPCSREPLRGSRTHLFTKASRQRSCAHPRVPRDDRKQKVLLEIVLYPDQKRSD